MVFELVIYCAAREFGDRERRMNEETSLNRAKLTSLSQIMSPQRFERLYLVCDQMAKADTGVHQPRDRLTVIDQAMDPSDKINENI